MRWGPERSRAPGLLAWTWMGWAACAAGCGSPDVAPAPAERTPAHPPVVETAPEHDPDQTEPAAGPLADAPDLDAPEPSSSEPEAERDCRGWMEGQPGAPVATRRLRRYASDDYVVEDLWGNLSVRRTGRRLRVRWWMEDRGCEWTTEIVRAGDLVALRESTDPRARCAIVGATLVETRIPLNESDRRVCLPGQSAPIDLRDLARFSAPPIQPQRRTSERIDPWAQ